MKVLGFAKRGIEKSDEAMKGRGVGGARNSIITNIREANKAGQTTRLSFRRSRGIGSKRKSPRGNFENLRPSHSPRAARSNGKDEQLKVGVGPD
jgi:hypothetical protein